MVREKIQRIAFTVRLPEELHKSVRVFAAANGLELQDVMEAAALAYLSGGGGHRPASCPMATAAPAENGLVRDFLAFYRSLGPEVQDYIRAAVRVRLVN